MLPRSRRFSPEGRVHCHLDFCSRLVYVKNTPPRVVSTRTADCLQSFLVVKPHAIRERARVCVRVYLSDWLTGHLGRTRVTPLETTWKLDGEIRDRSVARFRSRRHSLWRFVYYGGPRVRGREHSNVHGKLFANYIFMYRVINWTFSPGFPRSCVSTGLSIFPVRPLVQIARYETIVLSSTRKRLVLIFSARSVFRVTGFL